MDPREAGRDRRDLAQALKTLRLVVGLSGVRLAVCCGISQSKISRIESGRVLPSVVDVQLIVQALHLDQQTAADLVALARRANIDYECVRASVRRGLHHRQRELAALEAAATRMRFFLPAIPTSLLQTAEYMRTVMTRPTSAAQGNVARAIALKLERQTVLHDGSKLFEFLLTESAIRWRMGSPGLMALQLDRLSSLSRLSGVRICVLPLSRVVQESAFHTFTVYDRSLVTAELFSGRVAMRDPKDVDHYIALFEFMLSHAETGDSARHLLARWADDFRDEGEQMPERE
ncbi:helix-turn-helix domain-containing protein [Streptomyces hainanensis]|uniref:helix-turn-helix domain-containing protein n=1 Tax=Streptomyces hainanensis TaxID=402648 RepID=UPI002441470D|nr:helix-turn-helix transcriptional regulator [Streptomyces hainanensis]